MAYRHVWMLVLFVIFNSLQVRQAFQGHTHLMNAKLKCQHSRSKSLLADEFACTVTYKVLEKCGGGQIANI